MKWVNLKNNKCPQCNKDLMRGIEYKMMPGSIKILIHPCGFKISEQKYKEIVESLVTRGLRADQIIHDEYDENN